MTKTIVCCAVVAAIGFVSSGCGTLNRDQGSNVADIAKAKYGQQTDFETVSIKGTNCSLKIEGATEIAFRSYKPAISIVPEPSIMDRVMDTLKWLGGFYFGSQALQAVSEKTIVPTTVVEKQVLVPVEGAVQ